MKLAVHQPQYMPWMGYFHKMASADLFVFLDDVQFKKNEWQHRNRIRGPQGWQWLSVPNSYKFPQCINEVVVREETGWREKHRRALRMCYAKARFGHEYLGRFDEYFAFRRVTMAEVATASVKLLAALLGIATPLELSSRHGVEGVSTERLVNLCRRFGADTYLAGAGGRDYMDVSLFEEAGVAVEFQDFTCPVYPQRWAGTCDEFIPDLSVIDLLLNCGPQSRDVLMGGR